MYKILLDSRSSYHPIRVRKPDQEKLALFTPSGEKKTYNVLPFGPTNAPGYYTAMMQSLRKEWLLLFSTTKHLVRVTLPTIEIMCDDKIIIDDILLYSNHVPTFLNYFSCVAQVFTKYRLSFKLTKCDFFKKRFEVVWHDLTTYGNCPAASKFDLIKDLSLPPHVVSLLSFISLCSFYSRYCPWFETNIKPLRKLQRCFHRQSIPIMAWTPFLITLFDSCKQHLVSFPLLLRYDSSKLVFLKTDWSTGGMGYILMQVDDFPQSIEAVQTLENTGDFLFNLSLDGPRFPTYFFGSRSNQSYEENYHYFVGEVACGRWAIICCRKYLRGKKLY